MRHKPPDPEELERILSDLRDKILVVEGVRDEKALKSLGLNNIIKISRKPLYQVAEEVHGRLSSICPSRQTERTSLAAKPKSKEVVILTDFDRKGRALAARLSRLLMPYKIRINRRLRRKIMEFGKSEIQDFRNLREDDLDVKTGTDFDKICDKGKDKGKGRCGEA